MRGKSREQKIFIKKLSRITITGIFATTWLGGNGLYVHAEAQPSDKQAHAWSSVTLNEGQRYGIFPIGWLNDGTIIDNMTPDKFKVLIEGTEAKLDKLSFSKKNTVLDCPTDQVITRGVVMNWIAGNKDNMSKKSDEDTSDDRLLGTRDKRMADKLSELLEQEGTHTSFVVVGANHYVTKGMVVDQLKAKGYNVEFIQ